MSTRVLEHWRVPETGRVHLVARTVDAGSGIQPSRALCGVRSRGLFWTEEPGAPVTCGPCRRAAADREEP